MPAKSIDIPMVDIDALGMELLFETDTKMNQGIVDKTLGSISNVSLISTPEAKGHGMKLDEASIQSFYNAVEGKTIKAYYTHSPSNEALDSIGLWSEFEIVQDGEYTKLTAKFQALESWKEHQQGDYDALFELAEKAPEAFGVSAEFQAETIYYNEEGEAQQYNGQENVEVYARAISVSAFSIVAQPAANPTGLFAEAKEENNVEEVAGNLIKLQEENDRLALDLDASQKAVDAASKSNEELQKQVEDLQEKLASMDARFKTMVEETGSDPVHASAEVAPVTFEEKLVNCKTWAEKQNLINQNMSELVRTWNQ